jgi:hypothetical protein
VSARGAEVNGIEKMAEKIVSRGVLLDIARFKGLEALVLGYPVTEQDLIGCAAAEEVKIGRGDIVLVRTGQLGYCKKNGWGTFCRRRRSGTFLHHCGLALPHRDRRHRERHLGARSAAQRTARRFSAATSGDDPQYWFVGRRNFSISKRLRRIVPPIKFMSSCSSLRRSR